MSKVITNLVKVESIKSIEFTGKLRSNYSTSYNGDTWFIDNDSLSDWLDKFEDKELKITIEVIK